MPWVCWPQVGCVSGFGSEVGPPVFVVDISVELPFRSPVLGDRMVVTVCNDKEDIV